MTLEAVGVDGKGGAIVTEQRPFEHVASSEERVANGWAITRVAAAV